MKDRNIEAALVAVCEQREGANSPRDAARFLNRAYESLQTAQFAHVVGFEIDEIREHLRHALVCTGLAKVPASVDQAVKSAILNLECAK